MDTNKTYRENVFRLADNILRSCDAKPVESVEGALAVILSAIGENALSGTDQNPDPVHTSLEKCSVTACFMAACSVPLISSLQEMDCRVDVLPIMDRAGARVFKRYQESDRKIIMESGIFMFKEMVQTAGNNLKMAEWLSSIHNVTNRYVQTEGTTDCTDLFAPLYMVLLLATKQFKA